VDVRYQAVTNLLYTGAMGADDRPLPDSRRMPLCAVGNAHSSYHELEYRMAVDAHIVGTDNTKS